mmetsp:Transcript_31131/g.92508  ORF Transcript_31131/g.92508 Transcript_31131/m.92508 type:complete len:205 (+) Transcript_31131:725-1339(+)
MAAAGEAERAVASVKGERSGCKGDGGESEGGEGVGGEGKRGKDGEGGSKGGGLENSGNDGGGEEGGGDGMGDVYGLGVIEGGSSLAITTRMAAEATATGEPAVKASGSGGDDGDRFDGEEVGSEDSGSNGEGAMIQSWEVVDQVERGERRGVGSGGAGIAVTTAAAASTGTEGGGGFGGEGDGESGGRRQTRKQILLASCAHRH